ncbi:14698_t:CDS:2, partial [Funneliformis caledonium]
MRRYLRSDATLLSPETYSDIINAKGKKNISPVLAKKYKISSRKVYQIWRGQEYPPRQIAHSTNAPDTPDTLRITNTSHRFNNLHTFFTNIMDRARSVHSTDASDTLHTTHSINILHYEDIMQYRDMKSKPLEQLRKKFHISSSRLYQIWRGQE